MINKFLIMLAFLSLVSCGGMTKNDEESLDDQDNIEVVNSEEDDDIVVLDEDVDEENQEIAATEEAADEPADEFAATEEPVSESEEEVASNEAPIEANPQYGEHTVVAGETLGVIASKIYGDFRKWRSIYLENEEQLDATPLTAGTVLKYTMPADGEVIRPEGTPYLILRNETLGVISAKTYDGSTKHWKKIWKNNHKLIWDPNLIFAGLTIFTPDLSINEREVANKM